MNIRRTPGLWFRAGAGAAIGLGLALGGSGVAAASPTSGGFVVRVGELVLSSVGAQYTGTMQVTARNTGSEEVSDAALALTVPAGLRFIGVTSGEGCAGVIDVWCSLDTFAAGETRTMTVTFGSSAGPARYARVTETGTLAVSSDALHPGAREAARFAGVLRANSGSVAHPRPYRPSTAYDLALRATGSPVVTRDDAGVNVRLPLAAQDRTDAFNNGANVGATVDGLDATVWPSVDPSQPCTATCPVPGGDWLASGETRQFALLFTPPDTTPAGIYTVRVHGDLNAGTEPPPADLTPGNNTVVFTVVVPAI
jgi:hypothetical protein